MSKKRINPLAALLLVFSLGIAGCSGNVTSSGTDTGKEGKTTEGSAADAGKKVTIRIHLAEGEISKEQIETFEAEHPNIDLERVDTDFNKLMGQIAANSDTTPDIFRLMGASEFPFYASRGLALNLQPYFDKSKYFKPDDLIETTNIYRWDGKVSGKGDIYGFPKDWAPDFTLFINKKAFEAAGIPIPSDKEPLTWEKVMEYAEKMTVKEGSKITQWGIYDPLIGGIGLNQDIMLAQLSSLGQSLYTADNNEIVLNSPEAKRVVQYWVDAVKKPIGPSLLHSEAAHPVELFAQNKIGMIMVGYWFSGLLRSNDLTKNRLDDFMMLPAPVMSGGKRVEATRSGTGGIIYSKTKHPEEAWTVFEWFYGGKPADERAKSGWGLPSFKSKIDLLPKETNFDKQTYGVITDALNELSTLPYNPYISATAFGTLLDKYMTPVFFDKDTADGAIDKIAKEVKIQIRENKDIVGVK
ncbi:ABC transporter substrate-binding protein [Paenibacillus sp. GCM10027626]|uniref:ABC transporter substrate-binding protein n=1 Tax=Paenibacillus sp. GCM10027626 TaxID=3273411 RepID=UPI00363DB701